MPSANHTYDSTVENIARNTMEIQASCEGFVNPTVTTSYAAQGVSISKPVTEDHTVSSKGLSGSLDSVIDFFIIIDDSAQANAAPAIKKLPFIDVTLMNN